LLGVYKCILCTAKLTCGQTVSCGQRQIFFSSLLNLEIIEINNIYKTCGRMGLRREKKIDFSGDVNAETCFVDKMKKIIRYL
jgi:hypothetical protein